MQIRKDSPEGNAYCLMGIVHKLLKQTGRGKEWPHIQKRMKSGDYENLCRVANEVTRGSIEMIDDNEECLNETRRSLADLKRMIL